MTTTTTTTTTTINDDDDTVYLNDYYYYVRVVEYFILTTIVGKIKKLGNRIIMTLNGFFPTQFLSSFSSLFCVPV